MFQLKQKRDSFLLNVLIRYLASCLSSIWYGDSSNSVWQGDLSQGHCRWDGDDNNEFAVLWTPSLILAVASIPESERGDSWDRDWDEDKDPQGKTRGFKYILNTSEEMKGLYLEALKILGNEYVTAGFCGDGKGIDCSDSSANSLEAGLEYFTEYHLEPEKFLWGDGECVPLIESLSLTGPLEPVARLATQLSYLVMAGKKYKLSKDQVQLLGSTIKSEYGDIPPLDGWKDTLKTRFNPLGIEL